MNIEPVKWQAPVKELSLKAGEVHVWLIHASTQDYLAVYEKARAEKLISPLHRQRFTDTHNGLREILAQYVHQSPEDILFAQTPSGKPVLKNFPDVHFNLCHSEEIALCAISKNPVGIDVEYLDKKINYVDIAERFFSEAEYQYLKSLSKNEDLKLAFFKLWTQKECYLKSRGEGIATKLGFEVPSDFSIQHFIPAPHYLAAVGRAKYIKYYSLAPKANARFA